MSRRCVVFDYDGTLVDSRADIVNSVNLMLRCYGVDALPMEKILTFVGDGPRKLAERALAEIGKTKEINLDEALDGLLRAFRANMNLASTLYPGVFATLRELKSAGWKIALLSNKDEDVCKSSLFDFGIGNCFDLMIGCAGDDLPLKPAPDGLELICEMLSINDPSVCWMVGDGVNDILAGRSAGMKTCYASYGFGNGARETADARIERFDQLKELLQ